MKKMGRMIGNRLMQEKAYSLAELAIVSIIVGSIMAMALPNWSVTGEKTRSAEGVQIISAIWQANQLFRLENNNADAANVNQLQIDLPGGGNFNAPVIAPVAGQFVRIDRSVGLYQLYISDAGDLTCDDDGFAGARAGICLKMGYVDYD
jgi:competence protein ComGC